MKKIIFLFIVLGFLITSSLSSTYNVNEKTKIHFINVGQSSAFLVESNGKYGLIDTSNPSPTAIKPEAESEDIELEDIDVDEKHSVVQVINYLESVMGTNKLSFLIITHAHYDHNGGVKAIVDAGFVDSNTEYYYKKYEETWDDINYKRWGNKEYYNQAITAVESVNASLIDLTNSVGTEITEFEDLTISFYNTENRAKLVELGYVAEGSVAGSENENAIVTLITHTNGTKVLLTADIHVEQELRLVNNDKESKILDVDILKVAHHGIDSSSCYELLEHTSPEKIIVDNNSIGKEAIVRYCTENSKNPEISEISLEPEVYLIGKSTDAMIMRFYDDPAIKYDFIDGIIEGSSEKTESDFKLTGWQNLTGDDGIKRWFYFNDYGEMVTGFQNLSVTEGNYKFYFNSDGQMQTGWQLIDGKWYYFYKAGEGHEGAMVIGWQYLSVLDGNEYWFYLDNDGIMATGWREIDGNWYYFHQVGDKVQNSHEGAMVTGWQLLLGSDGNEYWFYFNENGQMVEGWQDLTVLTGEEYRFYFNEDGVMLKGWNKIDEKWYYFCQTTGEIENSYEGAMVTGWQYLSVLDGNEYWFYLANDGKMVTGWQEIDENWYYFSQAEDGIENSHEGAMLIGRYELTKDGEKNFYYFCELEGTPKGYKLGEMLANMTYNGYTYDSTGKEVKTYKIIYNANEGTETPEEQTKVHDQDIILRTEIPTREGYTFVSWEDRKEARTYNAGDIFEKNEDTTLYALWELETYEITYDLVGGSLEVTNPENYTVESEDIILNNPTREGYTFTGWTGTGLESTSTSAVIKKGSIGDRAYVATWVEEKLETYTISYNANGGIGAPEAQIKTKGVILTLSTIKPIRAGYEFINWKDNKTSKTYGPGEQFNTDANTVLYAEWEIKSIEDNEGSSIIIPYKIDAVQIWVEYFNFEKNLKEFYVQKQELVFQ